MPPINIDTREYSVAPNNVECTQVGINYPISVPFFPATKSGSFGYVKAFSADVASDRCCDSKKCVCLCSFFCKTFETKRDEMEGQGYKNCVMGRDKEGTVHKVEKSCQVKKRIEEELRKVLMRKSFT